MKFLNRLKAKFYKKKVSLCFSNPNPEKHQLLNKEMMYKYKDNLFTVKTDEEIGGTSTAKLEFSKEEGLKLKGRIDAKNYDKLEKYPFICLSYKVS